MGDALLVVLVTALADGAIPWRQSPAGLLDGVVYPTAPAGLRPHPDRQPGGPAGKLLELLGTWRWRRPRIDDYLLLGWVAAAQVGGALPWRVMIWLTGGHGTGKSSLEEAMKWLMGPGGMLHTPDATAASVRQTVKYSSLPVAIDEAEPDGDGRAMGALVKLARNAATGALSLRGGSDHESVSFRVQSCMTFASILVPPLLPQDRSRMAILEMDDLGGGPKPAGLTQRGMEDLGARVLRRLVDQWHRAGPTLEAYRDTMRQVGHSARGQDVFGTLLAMADLVLHDDLPDSDSLAGWADKLRPDKLAEAEGEVSDQRACLNHLLSTPLDAPHDLADELGCTKLEAFQTQIRAATELAPYLHGKAPVQVNVGGAIPILQLVDPRLLGLGEGAAVLDLTALQPIHNAQDGGSEGGTENG